MNTVIRGDQSKPLHESDIAPGRVCEVAEGSRGDIGPALPKNEFLTAKTPPETPREASPGAPRAPSPGSPGDPRGSKPPLEPYEGSLEQGFGGIPGTEGSLEIPDTPGL